MKKVKECDHCCKKFRNRASLQRHLMTFHGLDIFVRLPKKHLREGKPLRKVRMQMHAAMMKKGREHVSRKAHNHGLHKL